MSEQRFSSEAPGRRRRRPILRSILAVCAALIALGIAVPASSSAGPARYTHEVCDSALPGGGTPDVRYAVNPGVPFTPFNTCAEPGGSIGIVATGPTASTYAFWSIGIPGPPGGYVESLAFSGQACGLGPGNDRTFIYAQGWPASSCTESQRIFHVADSPGPFGTRGAGVTILMNCNGNYAPGCGAGPRVSARYIAATVVDPVAPVLEAPEGSLLAGGVLRGNQTLEAASEDQGGGLSEIVAVVNGQPAATEALDCNLVQTKNASYVGTVAVTVTPCPRTASASWTLNTALPPFRDGANSVQLCASDFSTLGSPNTTCSTHSVAVDNSCTESPVAGGEVLSASFARSRSERVKVPFRRAEDVVGELANSAGDPISGATICIQGEVQGSERGLRPLGTASTDANGHFVYELKPGPNRRLLVGYRHDSFQVGRSINYYAHAKPTLRLRPSRVKAGGTIRIRGRLPQPQAGGRVVVLQASGLRSKHWYTFRRATTNRKGYFRARYRFDATSRTTTYRLRAVVPRQRGYAWEEGHSKPARVKVVKR